MPHTSVTLTALDSVPAFLQTTEKYIFSYFGISMWTLKSKCNTKREPGQCIKTPAFRCFYKRIIFFKAQAFGNDYPTSHSTTTTTKSATSTLSTNTTAASTTTTPHTSSLSSTTSIGTTNTNPQSNIYFMLLSFIS